MQREKKTTSRSVFQQAPIGVSEDRREDETNPFNLADVRYVVSKDSMLRAWKRVKSNKGAPGIDNISIDKYPKWIKRRWERIKEAILNDTFNPRPVRRVEIEKDDGSKRKLGIPCVLERTIQQAMAYTLGTIFEPRFSESSYGYRRHRSVHMAVDAAVAHYRSGYKFQVIIDLEKFFDTVNHDVLMERVSRRVKDKKFLRLLGRFLRARTLVGDQLELGKEGVPQGGPLSPILSNILLDDLDKELESRGHKFVRYADDLSIFVKSKRAGERVMKSITRYLEDILKVRVNTLKSSVSKVADSSVLGFYIHRPKLRIEEKRIAKFKRNLKEATSRRKGVSMKHRLQKLKEKSQGWMAHYGRGLSFNDAVEFDKWLRRRLRMCYWKQWKKPRTRIRNLLKRLGQDRVSRSKLKKSAINTGLSRKSYWRLSRNPAINQAIGNARLVAEGFYSIKESWCQIHYPNQEK